ncbi:hypothetical protein [Iodobacter ciconiae]|uniref:Uncharacterized protein n=1 Tax=Iodobacter ciconiae TaxID=2496266 RepID=A0A3S8ZVX7_9NEIS|nr:hypothetical protein [Iodobacter ciconiae]AZN37598.1 hypothetical protein EJO50_14615 [Iodobacter ciconiae]
MWTEQHGLEQVWIAALASMPEARLYIHLSGAGNEYLFAKSPHFLLGYILAIHVALSYACFSAAGHKKSTIRLPKP